MKRSEVIKILADKFKSVEIPEPYMWANDILDILERRLGMLPPYDQSKDMTEWITPFNTTQGCKWEDKDE